LSDLLGSNKVKDLGDAVIKYYQNNPNFINSDSRNSRSIYSKEKLVLNLLSKNEDSIAPKIMETDDEELAIKMEKIKGDNLRETIIQFEAAPKLVEETLKDLPDIAVELHHQLDNIIGSLIKSNFESIYPSITNSKRKVKHYLKSIANYYNLGDLNKIGINLDKFSYQFMEREFSILYSNYEFSNLKKQPQFLITDRGAELLLELYSTFNENPNFLDTKEDFDKDYESMCCRLKLDKRKSKDSFLVDLRKEMGDYLVKNDNYIYDVLSFIKRYESELNNKSPLTKINLIKNKYIDNFLFGDKEYIQDRINEGSMRLIHGDLELHHIYFKDTKPKVIDYDEVRIESPLTDLVSILDNPEFEESWNLENENKSYQNLLSYFNQMNGQLGEFDKIYLKWKFMDSKIKRRLRLFSILTKKSPERFSKIYGNYEQYHKLIDNPEKLKKQVIENYANNFKELLEHYERAVLPEENHMLYDQVKSLKDFFKKTKIIN
jgi:hypothetical protein